MNKGIIRGLDPNAFALNKPGGVSIVSSDLNAVPLTITGENGQSANLINITAFGGTAGALFNVASNGALSLAQGITTSGGVITNASGRFLAGGSQAAWLEAPSSTNTSGLRGPGSNNILVGQGVSSSVNYVQITNAITGNAPIIASTGTDTDIDLILNSKGAGLVNIGPASASVAVGGGSTPPLLATAGIGQAGQPTTAAQNSWLEIKINGTASWIPVWR